MKYNYFYDGRPISSVNFRASVPEGWESEVVDGKYSYGSYDAYERDD